MNLTILFKTIFNNKSEYSRLTNSDKQTWVFKINSYLGRVYPNNAEVLNNKNYDPSMVCDIWFNSLKKINKIPNGIFPDKIQPNKIQTLEEKILSRFPKDEIVNSITTKKIKKKS